MAKREWIGNYSFYYTEYLTHSSKTIIRNYNLGKCLGVDEAIEKAVAFMSEQDHITPLYIRDGWGNKIKA